LARPVLINTITSMVLISIHPFAVRKLFLIIVAFLCFSAVCLADPVLMVRRYASHTERLEAARVSVSTWQEPGGGGRTTIVDPYVAHFESADLAERQPGATSIDGGNTGLLPAVSSWVFRNASCTLRSSGPAAIHDGPILREPTDT